MFAVKNHSLQVKNTNFKSSTENQKKEKKAKLLLRFTLKIGGA